MKYFCTYFDSNFLYKGLALYDSLSSYAGYFKLWVLCLDEKTYTLLNELSLPNLSIISMNDFEVANPELLEIKNKRLLHEYYWTITPLLPLGLLKKIPEIDMIAYLDADLFFYSDIQPIYEEWGKGSIYIIPHRFPQNKKQDAHLVGIYNVGFVGHRRDMSGLACLERWASQCLEWCHQQYGKSGAYGDQKYLDTWPSEYSNCIVSENHGVGVGGWNILNYRIHVNNEQIFLGDYKLIMAHLNFIEILSKKHFAACSRWILQPIYSPYANALKKSIDMIHSISPGFEPVFHKLSPFKWMIKSIRGGIVKIT